MKKRNKKNAADQGKHILGANRLFIICFIGFFTLY
ncbi:MAG: hypothetical protein H6Q20_532 [Bacteroidetes bacterium]|nr:hypothetical protein [Bacteroidota bacterium]